MNLVKHVLSIWITKVKIVCIHIQRIEKCNSNFIGLALVAGWLSCLRGSNNIQTFPGFCSVTIDHTTPFSPLPFVLLFAEQSSICFWSCKSLKQGLSWYKEWVSTFILPLWPYAFVHSFVFLHHNGFCFPLCSFIFASFFSAP